MNFLLKLLRVPASNEKKFVKAVQLWEVRWTSRNGEYSHCTQPELECFTDEATAKSFAESLRNAFELIRHTSGNNVIVTKAVRSA